MAVIDLDLVYETLDPRRRTKDNPDLWAQARRVAGRLATALLAENRCVVAEGEFARDQALDEFVGEFARHHGPASSASRRELRDGVETRIGRCNSWSVEG